MNKKYHKKTFDNIPEEKRDRILQAAITEFAKNGFNGANINTIAENADISVGSVYKYFSSKDDLFLSVVNRGYGLLEEVFSTTALSTGDFFDTIEELLRAAQKYAIEYPELNQIYLDLATEGLSHLSKRLSRTVESISAEFYLSIIAKAKKDGIIPPDLDDQIASFCLDNLLLMVQYSYTSKYFMERMKIFLGDKKAKDKERIIQGIMQFIRGGFSRGSLNRGKK